MPTSPLLLQASCTPLFKDPQPSRHAPDRRRPVHTNDHRGTGELWACGQTSAPTPCFSIGIDPNDVQGFQRGALLDRCHPGRHHGIVRRSRRSCPSLCRGVTRMARPPLEPCRFDRQCPREHVGVGCRASSRPLVWRRHSKRRVGHRGCHVQRCSNLHFFKASRTGFILGAEGYKMLRVKYNESKDFQGSLDAQTGRQLGARPEHSTQTTLRLVQSTVVLVASSRDWTRRPTKRPFSKDKCRKNGPWAEGFNGTAPRVDDLACSSTTTNNPGRPPKQPSII